MAFLSVLAAAAGFLITIGIVVVIHEGGHFLAAKWLGFAVKRFSIGMGRVLWRRRGWDTEFAFSMLPIGGYVSFHESARDEAGRPVKGFLFETGPRWRRAVVIVAGPLMNFVLAVLLFTAAGAAGVEDFVPRVAALPGSQAESLGVERLDRVTAVEGRPVSGLMELNSALVERTGEKDVAIEFDRRGERMTLHFSLADVSLDGATKRGGLVLPLLGLRPAGEGVLVVETMKDGPAAAAGLVAGDVIRSADGRPVAMRDFAAMIRENAGRTLTLEVESLGGGSSAAPGALRTVRLTPRSVTDERTGEVIGRADLRFGEGMERILVRRGPLESLRVAVSRTVGLTRLQASAVGGMATGEVSTESLSGPVGIAGMAGGALVSGLAPFLEFLALISIAIGFMNLIPIPALDGGQLVILAGEALAGRSLSKGVREKLALASMALLALLAVYVTINDIGRL